MPSQHGSPSIHHAPNQLSTLGRYVTSLVGVSAPGTTSRPPLCFRGDVPSLLDSYLGYFGKCSKNVVCRTVDVVTRLGLLALASDRLGSRSPKWAAGLEKVCMDKFDLTREIWMTSCPHSSPFLAQSFCAESQFGQLKMKPYNKGLNRPVCTRHLKFSNLTAAAGAMTNKQSTLKNSDRGGQADHAAGTGWPMHLSESAQASTGFQRAKNPSFRAPSFGA